MRIRAALEQQVTPIVKGVTDVATLRKLWEVLGARQVIPAEISWEPVMCEQVQCEWIQGPATLPGKAMLYMHGGAFVFGSAATYRELLGRLSMATGLRVLAPDYRLAPEHPYPAALHDVLGVYRWLLGNGVESRHLVIAGDSAGGALALSALVALRDEGEPLPAVAVLLSPGTDLTCSSESYVSRAKLDPIFTRDAIVSLVARYLAGADPTSPLVSPLFADLRGLPPIIIHVGSDEVLVDDSTRLAERARSAGVEVELQIWEGMWHDFQRSVGTGVIEGQESIDLIGEFIKQRIAIS